jgi:hypothetical protein
MVTAFHCPQDIEISKKEMTGLFVIDSARSRTPGARRSDAQ